MLSLFLIVVSIELLNVFKLPVVLSIEFNLLFWVELSLATELLKLLIEFDIEPLNVS